MIRKKMLRLLRCDYQRAARYYTIYRTFKTWSSDDFATIPRLFFGRNYDYLLRLLPALISYRAKARKEIRREPQMVPRRLRHAGPVQVETLTHQQVRWVQHLPEIHTR